MWKVLLILWTNCKNCCTLNIHIAHDITKRLRCSFCTREFHKKPSQSPGGGRIEGGEKTCLNAFPSLPKWSGSEGRTNMMTSLLYYIIMLGPTPLLPGMPPKPSGMPSWNAPQPLFLLECLAWHAHGWSLGTALTCRLYFDLSVPRRFTV